MFHPNTVLKTLSPALLVAALLGSSAAVSAAEYTQVVPAESDISFTFTQMNVKLNGTFKDFSADLRFDPALPEQAQARFELKPASISTGTREADEEAVASDWFAVESHPLARFESTQVRALGNGQYEAQGTLNIKGREQPLTVPFTVEEGGEQAVFKAEFEIKRSDFAIGEGMWADTGIVADEVQVRVQLTVTP